LKSLIPLKKRKNDIVPSLEFAVSIKGIKGALAVVGKYLGSIGDIELM